MRLLDLDHCVIDSHFNPHTPRGVRRGRPGYPEAHYIFQSTHPSRGATFCSTLKFGGTNISIHTPLAGCDKSSMTYNEAKDISIHTPLAGCDKTISATRYATTISIHTPLAGCDAMSRARHLDQWNFNPHTPRGVRPVTAIDTAFARRYFNPHTPRGVRPCHRWLRGRSVAFQS